MDAETVKKLLGNNIRTYRRTIGLTQSELGKRINIDQRQVAYIENGHSFPSLPTLLKFTEIFNCDLKTLFEFDIELEDVDLKTRLTQRISSLNHEKSKMFYKLLNILGTNY